MTAVDQKAKQETKSKADEIASGKFKSGSVWKEKSSKFSNLLLQKSNRTSWEKKMRLKAEHKNVKMIQSQIKEQRKIEAKKKHPKPAKSTTIGQQQQQNKGPLKVKSKKELAKAQKKTKSKRK